MCTYILFVHLYASAFQMTYYALKTEVLLQNSPIMSQKCYYVCNYMLHSQSRIYIRTILVQKLHLLQFPFETMYRMLNFTNSKSNNEKVSTMLHIR